MAYISGGTAALSIGAGITSFGAGFAGGFLKSKMGSFSDQAIATSSCAFGTAATCLKGYLQTPMGLGGPIGAFIGWGLIAATGGTSAFAGLAITSLSTAAGMEVDNSELYLKDHSELDLHLVDINNYDGI